MPELVTTHLELARHHHVDDKVIPSRLNSYLPAARKHAHGLLRSGWTQITALDDTGTVRALDLLPPGTAGYTAMTGQPCPDNPAADDLTGAHLTASLSSSGVRPLLAATITEYLTGEWTDRSTIIDKVVGLIPVRVAEEHMAAKIRRDSRRRGVTPVLPSQTALIRRGRRDLAGAVLASLVRDGRVERVDGQVRRRASNTSAA